MHRFLTNSIFCYFTLQNVRILPKGLLLDKDLILLTGGSREPNDTHHIIVNISLFSTFIPTCHCEAWRNPCYNTIFVCVSNLTLTLTFYCVEMIFCEWSNPSWYGPFSIDLLVKVKNVLCCPLFIDRFCAQEFLSSMIAFLPNLHETFILNSWICSHIYLLSLFHFSRELFMDISIFFLTGGIIWRS